MSPTNDARVVIFGMFGLLGASAGCSSEADDAGATAPAPRDEVALRTTPIALAPGEERYFCWSVAIPDSGVFPLAAIDFEMPAGVHHYQLQTQGEVPPEAPWDCGMEMGGGPPGGGDGPPDDDGGGPGGPPPGVIPTILAVGGPGTPSSMQFPDGSAAMLDPGTHMVMQLHVFNTTGESFDLAQATAHLLKAAAPAEDLAPIGVVLVNDGTLELPPGGKDVEAGHDCVVPAALDRVFSVWPHMHQLGKHISVSLGGQPVADVDWTFDKQLFYPADASLAAGDTIGLRCRYDNPTDEAVTFGMSTDDEMCTAFVYYYPRIDDFGFCEKDFQ